MSQGLEQERLRKLSVRDDTRPFLLRSEYQPRGDQPYAIASLVSAVSAGRRRQTLLGVTGSGKTFTMANVIAELNRPALVLAHNKTLAAQLFSEFSELFPENAVRYFVSYYDYYQPEAYVPSTDTFIEKDASINSEIDKLRHAATKALLERRDVVVVASVSCIYGLGDPKSYFELILYLERGDRIDRNDVLKKLVFLQYSREDIEFRTGAFRVRGDVVEICPASESDRIIRVEFFGDEIEELCEVDRLTGKVLRRIDRACIYPASHFVTKRSAIERAIQSIRVELEQRLAVLEREGKTLEANRLERRTLYDLELLDEMGFCPGIENYSRHLAGRAEGETPATLLDYFPEDLLVFIDESHVTLPQLVGMYRGDRSRKQNLVDYGFRLPSALDNRPLMFPEFEQKVSQAVYVSATPGEFEVRDSEGLVVEQIIRPTGLLDPVVEVRPASNQVEDCLEQIHRVTAAGNRSLVTTLTKKMAEDLTNYYHQLGVKVKYLHSEVHTLDRVDLIRALRGGEFDVLVGINLLREGLDLPEVGFVAILDADKEGFLRSATSLVQTIGRASRNVAGLVVLYGDRITGSMKQALEETERRRARQDSYNQQHGITPTTVKRAPEILLVPLDELAELTVGARGAKGKLPKDRDACKAMIAELTKQMFAAAKSHEFEKAAAIRDRIKLLEKLLLSF